MQVVLAMFKSDGDRRSFSLHKDTTVIGRREDCDLRIPLGEISRKHCRLIKDGDALRVEDMGSSNGTYHNGQRVQEAVIQPGDTVQVGSIAFVVQIDGAPGDDELQPVIAAAAEVNTEGSGTPVGSEEAVVDESGAPVNESGAPVEAAAGDGDDFDPMAFLEGGDSQASGAAMNIDMEQSRHGEDD